MPLSLQTYSDSLLFVTSMIWGFAFVAQRVSMNYLGPFTFNGVCFALGGLFMLLLLFSKDREKGRTTVPILGGPRSAPV